MAQPPIAAPGTVVADDWGDLRRHTAARIALGHCGAGLPTAAHLAFQAAHAQARDAVHDPLDIETLTKAMAAQGWDWVQVASQAPDRPAYLTRPDLGRLLSPASVDALSQPAPAADIAIIVGDGLSGRAVMENAVATLAALLPLLKAKGHHAGPVVIATQARVALADHVGELLQAEASIVLIGERPGLSAADSLGLYLTWNPRRGRVDAERNCISNVRAGGLPPEEAARQADALIAAMFRHKTAGVALGRIERPRLGPAGDQA